MSIMINKELTEPQMDMFMMRQWAIPNALFTGGYGCGKSEILVSNAVRDVMLFRGCKVAVYAPTIDLITLNILPRLEQELLSLGIKYTLNKQDKILYIQGARQIIYRSLNDPAKIVAYEVYASHIDEADLLPTIAKANDAYSRILGRNRQVWKLNNGKKHPKHFNMVSSYSTPEGFKFTYERWKKNPGAGYRYVTAPTSSNWNLDGAFISNLLDSYTPEQCKAYLLGDWVNILTGSVYSYFDRERHNVTRIIQPKEPLMISCDFNFGGSCCAVYVDKYAAADDHEKRIITTTEELEELKAKFNTKTAKAGVPVGLDMLMEFDTVDTEKMAEYIHENFKGHPVTMFPDASGRKNTTNASRSDIAILKQAGFYVSAGKTNPRIEDRINSVQRLLYKGLFGINTDLCPKTTLAMEEHAYNESTGLPEKIAGSATVDDRTDSMGYCPSRKFPIKQYGRTFLKKASGF